jgi:hypothetical protein
MEIEPLPPEIQSLFASADAPPPAGAKNRVRTRLRLALGIGASLGAGGVASAAVKGTLVTVASKSPLLVGAIAALAAGAGGLGWMALRSEPPPPAAEVAPPAPGAPERSPAAELGPSRGDSSALAREQSLLARARAALGRGDLDAGFAALEQHAAQFAGGTLREERETLWIVGLARRGKLAAARARAARFRQLYPGSIQLGTFEQAVRDPGASTR